MHLHHSEKREVAPPFHVFNVHYMVAVVSLEVVVSSEIVLALPHGVNGGPGFTELVYGVGNVEYFLYDYLMPWG